MMIAKLAILSVLLSVACALLSDSSSGGVRLEERNSLHRHGRNQPAHLLLDLGNEKHPGGGKKALNVRPLDLGIELTPLNKKASNVRPLDLGIELTPLNKKLLKNHSQLKRLDQVVGVEDPSVWSLKTDDPNALKALKVTLQKNPNYLNLQILKADQYWEDLESDTNFAADIVLRLALASCPWKDFTCNLESASEFGVYEAIVHFDDMFDESAPVYLRLLYKLVDN